MNTSTSHNSLSTKSGQHKQLGVILSDAGLISAQQIEVALRDQLRNSEMRIGEILALRGWIKQETADFFVERWGELVEQPQKKPLVYYFRESALLDEDQISAILLEKSKRMEKVRFHQVAVQMGLISQQTVDFFIKNLMIGAQRKRSSRKSSFATPYELLKNYIRGETNFQRSQLKKIQLNHVTLKAVNLDSSNLTGAELKQANLNNSSFKDANLSNANLEKALLKEVDFESACLNRVNLTDAHLEGSNFKAASLKEADLRDGYFVNVSFQGADLSKAKLQGANLKGALYNAQTIFDPDFDPTNVGMELV
ncbi:pentapeptide repeat-containing protein [Pleurocapsa sp. PCC 7319]|uniref:pentapeptide repeat-containing protein n=1 Tax=Pleurocapsa sp. PCC 7319 TaxID=118161 RepID=UPI00034DAFC6|nr:pentapeptide repeat-containing protein [Pleurocapsa sp. PCC 7319]